jgi:hypothetical protein
LLTEMVKDVIETKEIIVGSEKIWSNIMEKNE